MDFKKIAAVFLVFSSQAHAFPVEFTFNTLISYAGISGVESDAPLSIHLLMDNGGSDLVGRQAWSVDNIISGRLETGSYSQSFSDAWYVGNPEFVFMTDPNGAVVLADFYGTDLSANHQDSFGVGGNIQLFNGAFQDFYGNMSYFYTQLTLTDNWSYKPAVTDVPEPSPLPLVSLGVSLMIAVRCLRKRLVDTFIA
ncbi:MAG: hypothetical protein JWM78_1580 [Verrucomicrobiaceae bacterium]|nr:hypothetical protein [Verrucomicrobiaceae bacterium]